MFHGKAFRTVSLIIIGAAITLASYSQTSKSTKGPHSKKATIGVLVSRDPDPRSRNSRDEREREKAKARNGAGTWMRQGKEVANQIRPTSKPVESRLTKAGTFNDDVRNLPRKKLVRRDRPEREGPEPNPAFIDKQKIDRLADDSGGADNEIAQIAPLAPAPATTMNFNGLDYANWGAGHPPDTNGDVGPNHYIQTINSSVGIYDKFTGARIAAFTFDTLMSQGNFGNLCDTDNFGDPVVLYDTFEDRWVLADFAFKLDGANNVINPPGAYQCFAVSKTGDPVAGGWNFYSVNTTGGLGDYPKFGVWPDGIYMSANMFDYASGGSFQNARVYAFNKAQMYAGAPTVQIVSFDAPSTDFALLPSNARLQTGTPPAGSPNYFVSTWQFLNAVGVYKFHVDWDRIPLSTFTGPDAPVASTGWPNASVPNAPSQGGIAAGLDVLQIRAMMQNQYTNFGGTESLWATHTVRRANTTGFAAPRWYQLNVTGGTVAPTIPQATTWDPDGANLMYRFIPSLAVNRMGDLALAYSTSSSTTKPAIKYAGRLAGDPANTFSLSEQVLIQGTGTQTGTSRWGDYSSMTLDPDGCTFWFTSEYLAVDGNNYQTRIGSFAYPSCSAYSNNGGIEGTVTSAVTGQPLAGVTVSLGSRSATTDGNGFYSFAGVPQGKYPSISAASAGYITKNASDIAVTDGNVTTQNFALSAASDSDCGTDTTQADFQSGVPTNVDLTNSSGDVKLSATAVINQQNTTLGNQGAGLSNTTWLAQTFTASSTGPVTRIDLNLFSLSCSSVTMPNLTVSIRSASGDLPTGADLATATIPGFCNGAGGWFTATLSTPVTITAGTQYSIVWHAAASIPTGAGYYGTVSAGTGATSVQNPYAGGRRASSSNSGSTWTGASGNANNDHGFKIYIAPGYSSAGSLESHVKDSNPVSPGTTSWGAITWNAATPVGTSVTMQVAASNNINGPFVFVGPDGTASTYFSSGGSLARFNGYRYLKYKAYLTTSDSSVTPTLQDVTICFTNPRVWTGKVSSNWNDPANWSSSGVPGPGDAAVVPSTGVSNDPVNTSNASVSTLMLGAGRIVDTGANTLTVTSCLPSAVSAGSANSFVRGNLTRCVNNAGTFEFPVGTTSGYAPVSLSNIIGSGNFAVRPSNGVLTGVDPTKSISRYWDLTPISGVTQADITLMYGDGDVPAGADESAFKVIHKSSQSTFALDPTSKDTSLNSFRIDGVQGFSSWTLGSLLAPTAAPVNVSGRVTTAGGQAIRGAVVTITDDNGNSQSTITSSFGYYQFGNVAAGKTYVLSASAKRYNFSPRTLRLFDSLAEVNFIAAQ